METEANIVQGAVTVLGSFVSADVILPARHSFLKPRDMIEHVLEEVSAEVNASVCSCPIIVAGEGFGYGTGRESPARALSAAGIKAIIGGPFARMFFRNAINNGVLVLDCPAIVSSGITTGDDVEIDAASGSVRWKGYEFAAVPVPEFILAIVSAGSLIEHGRRTVQRMGGTLPI